MNISSPNILAEADVVVCGGGPAGLAAACSAARRGCQVILLERWPSVGGNWTNAMVNVWHVSDRTKQVIFGLMQETIERGGRWVTQFSDFPDKYETHWFDTDAMRMVFHQLLDDAGVRTICHVAATAPIVKEGRIRGVLVDTKSGRKAILGKIVIDCSGDGDLAAAAGIPFELGRTEDRRTQGMTLMFSLCGVDETAIEGNREANAKKVLDGMLKLRDAGRFSPFNVHMTRWYLQAGFKNRLVLNMCPVVGDALNEECLTELTVRARKQLYEYLAYWRANMPGMEHAEIEKMGFVLGVRETRRLQGLKTFDTDMITQATKHMDAVGHGFWPVDIHDPKGSGHTGYFEKTHVAPPIGESYHIPLGVCLNDKIPNLAFAGRCSSSTHEGLASIRLGTHCSVMGQGLGTAAALALGSNKELTQIDIQKLQRWLISDGVYLMDVPDT